MIDSLQEEKRQFPRLRIPLPANAILDPADDPIDCVVQNLSAGGAQLGTRQDVPIESRLLEVRFSLEIEGHPRPIEVAPPARVIYCEPVEGRSETFAVGVRFIDADSDEVALIQKFVYYQLVKNASQPPSTDDLPAWKRRVNIQQPIAIRFGKFDEFVSEVTYNLSATGMFIKSRRPLPAGSVFDFEFQLGEDFSLLKGKAEVVWGRERAEGATRPAGMGVHFVDLEESSRKLIERLVEENLEREEESDVVATGLDDSSNLETMPEGRDAPAEWEPFSTELESPEASSLDDAGFDALSVPAEAAIPGDAESPEDAQSGDTLGNSPEATPESTPDSPDDRTDYTLEDRDSESADFEDRALQESASNGSSNVTSNEAADSGVLENGAFESRILETLGAVPASEAPSAELSDSLLDHTGSADPGDLAPLEDSDDPLATQEAEEAQEDDDPTFELLDSLMPVAESTAVGAGTRPWLSEHSDTEDDATAQADAVASSEEETDTFVEQLIVDEATTARIEELETARADAEQRLIDARKRELDLRVDLEKSLERAAEYEVDRDRLRAELDESLDNKASEIEIQALRTEVGTLQDALGNGSRELTESKERLEEQQNQNARLTSEIEEKTGTLSERDARVDELSAKLASATEQIDALVAETEQLTSDRDQAAADAEERSTAFLDLQSHADSSALEIARLTDASGAFETRFADLDAQAEQTRRENGRLREQLLAAETRESDFAEALEKAERERGKKSSLLRDALARLESIEKEHTGLRDESSGLTQQIERLEQKLEDSAQENQRLDQHSRDLEGRIANAAEKRREGHEKNREVERERDELLAKLAAVRTDADGDRERAEALESQVETLGASLQAAQQDYERETERTGVLTKSKEQADHELAKVREELTESVASASKSRERAEELETRLAAREVEDRDADARIRAAEDERERIREVLERTETENKSATETVSDLEAKIAGLETEATENQSALDDRIATLQAEIDRRTGLLETLESDLQASRSREADRNAEVRDLKARERELEESLTAAGSKSSDEADRLRAFAGALVGRVEELEAHAFALEEQHRGALDEIRLERESHLLFEQRDRFATARQSFDPEFVHDLEERLFFSENELSEVREGLQSATTEVETLIHERQQLESRIESREAFGAEHLAELTSATERARKAEQQRDAAVESANENSVALERERAAHEETKSALESTFAESKTYADEVETLRSQSAKKESSTARAEYLAGEIERRRVEARVLSGELETTRAALAAERKERENLESAAADRSTHPAELDRLRESQAQAELRIREAEKRASDADDRTVELERLLADRPPSRGDNASPRTKAALAQLLLGATVGAGLLFGIGSSPMGDRLFGRSAVEHAAPISAPAEDLAPTAERETAAGSVAKSGNESSALEPAETSETATPDLVDEPDPIALTTPSIDLEATIQSWADAWARQDADSYLSFYGADFTPPKQLGRAAWEAQRRQRIASPPSIRVDLGPMTPNPVHKERILVTFTQEYRTPTYRDKVTKTLDCIVEDGRWVIVGESSEPLS